MLNKREDMLVVVIDKTCDEKLGMYYRVFTDALKNNNRVVLVGVNDDNKSFKPLASLLVTYNEYGIYQIEDKSTLGAVELQKMCERKPDFSEVQTFIGGDVTAYADSIIFVLHCINCVFISLYALIILPPESLLCLSSLLVAFNFSFSLLKSSTDTSLRWTT